MNATDTSPGVDQPRAAAGVVARTRRRSRSGRIVVVATAAVRRQGNEKGSGHSHYDFPHHTLDLQSGWKIPQTLPEDSGSPASLSCRRFERWDQSHSGPTTVAEIVADLLRFWAVHPTAEAVSDSLWKGRMWVGNRTLW